MGLNLSNLETVLQSKVDGLTSSSTDKDVLLTSKSIEAATADVTVSDVITEGGTQVTAINSAASTKVGEVNTAGGTQVTAVNNAGTAQIALVNAIDTYTKAEANAKIVELSPPATKTHIESLGIAASSITGDLPAISGASLTGIDFVTKSATAPTSPTVGDLWYNTDINVLYTWNSADWSPTSRAPLTPSTLDLFGDNSCAALFEFNGNGSDTGGTYSASSPPGGYTTGSYLGSHAAYYISNGKVDISNVPSDFVSMWIQFNPGASAAGEYILEWRTHSGSSAGYLYATNNRILTSSDTTWNGQITRIHINGVIKTDYTFPDNIWVHLYFERTVSQQGFTGARLGSRFSDSEMFYGRHDNVRFWNRSLTTAEILSMYTGGY